MAEFHVTRWFLYNKGVPICKKLKLRGSLGSLHFVLVLISIPFFHDPFTYCKQAIGATWSYSAAPTPDGLEYDEKNLKIYQHASDFHGFCEAA